MNRTWKNVTVLVADDHGDIREVVCEYLNSFPGVRVIGQSENGLDAVKQVERFKPDLVLLDVGLPDLSAVEASRIIKRKSASTKVFLSTLYDEPLYEREALRASADGVISKSSLKRSLALLMRSVRRQAS